MFSSDLTTQDGERTRISAAVTRDLPASPAPIKNERLRDSNRITPPDRPGIDYFRNGHDPLILHRAVRREKEEALAGREPLSPWLISFFAVVLFAAAFYFGRYSGHFSGDSLDPVPTATDF